MAAVKPKRKRIAEKIEPAVVVVKLTVRQRCFYLFCALLLLIVAVPFLEGSTGGRLVLNGISLLVLISSAAAIGRGRLPLVLGLLLAGVAATFQISTLLLETTNLLVLSWGFSAAFHLLVVGYLLTNALRREVLTMDKLYGAAAAFIMLAVLWSYFYAILLAVEPGALTMNGTPISSAPTSTLMFFSVGTLTSTGMSDILPLHPVARMLCSLEMIAGVLFIAVLIARLAGTYPPEKP
jgi:hypothetical protein